MSLVAVVLVLYAILTLAACCAINVIVQKRWGLDGGTWAACSLLFIFVCLAVGFRISDQLNSFRIEIIIAIFAILLGTITMLGLAKYWSTKHRRLYD